MVAEELNISAAARRLNVTQPALSRQIKGLEDELGWTLLERGARSVSLTREGEVVAREGKKIVQGAEQGFLRMKHEIEGVELRIGFAPSLVKEILGTALDRFSQLYPQVRVSLRDLSSLEMETGVREGSLDLIVGAENQRASGIRWESLKRDGWRVLLPARHELAQHEVIKAEFLDGERLLLFSKEEYPEYWKTVTGFFRAQGINAKVAGEFDGATSLRAAVEGGMGVALLAAASLRDVTNLTVVRELTPVPGEMHIAAGFPSEGEHQFAEAFFAELRAACPEGRQK